jgi:outer membrane protein TolC
VPQQFFPTAERNQFVIDVWMGQGTRIEATDAVMRRIERYVAGRKEIQHFASFLGQSAPRFYYNVNPQQPDAAYGQFIVNTRSVDETPALVGELQTALATLAPEAMVIVKELQQGLIMEAPVEIRISGDDIGELKRLGAQVEGFVSAVPSSRFAHHDYYNDSCMVDINVDDELANRLGITNASVSKLVAGAFDGGPVSTFWEGDRAVTILLRLDQASRASFADIRDAYVTSHVTQARVPLRAITTLEPEWQTSRIVRRNGVRTLTVRSFVELGSYASGLLKAVQPQINALQLPPGYRIDYGGERSNQVETFPRMLVALGISLVAIFLTLLVQFRRISDTLIVMSSIPLALPGAVLGLIITRNQFGFTALVGLISLCGIVVRNAIILVDYVNEKMLEGHSLELAATEAGQRRLRPIFLTTMAAAVGVTPMILSGSSLWSPLASVIAIGLICSMFFTLLVVPVLFVIIKSHLRKPAASAVAVVVAVLLLTAGQTFAETKKLALSEAVDLALAQNTALKIARARVNENQQKVVSASADYFPRLSNDSTFLGLSDQQLITVPAGALGTVPGLGPFPLHDTSINQGSSTLFVNNTILSQPLTQLFKIHQAARIARSDQKIAEADVSKAENDVILAVHQLYYGLLIAGKQKEAAQAALAAAQEGLREAQDAVRTGDLLDVSVTENRAAMLQNKQSLLTVEMHISDLTSELDELLGLPTDTELELSDVGPSAFSVGDRGYYLQEALSRDPELEAAKAMVEKSRSAVSAAYDEYIPDISLFSVYTYQDGVPFLTNHIGTFGIMMSWNIWDWGKRSGVVGQRKAQLTQAEENLQRLKDRITVETEKAYRKLELSKSMVDVAREALALRRERQRLSANQLKAATTSYAKHAETVAAVKKAESDELQAILGYELARAELNRISGTFER